MTQVWERLFLGSLADAEELAADNPDGITTVISLSEVAVQTRREDVNYVHLPIEDDVPVPVRQFYGVMDAIRMNIRWGTVLLHCGVGVSRAPSMAAAYIDSVGCKGIDAALAEIKLLRPFIQPSTILLNSVKEHLK
jgi:protein-tyrosine phosphatase